MNQLDNFHTNTFLVIINYTLLAHRIFTKFQNQSTFKIFLSGSRGPVPYTMLLAWDQKLFFLLGGMTLFLSFSQLVFPLRARAVASRLARPQSEDAPRSMST